MAGSLSANRKTAQKAAAKKRPQTWKPGQSGNPAGGPKRGQSWRELIAELGDLDGPSAAERVGFLAAQFRKLTPGVTLKELVVLRVYAALIDEPQPGLLNALVDRVEGKVAQAIELTTQERTAFEYEAAVTALTGGPGGNSATPGPGEGDRQRPALGEVVHGGDDGPGDG